MNQIPTYITPFHLAATSGVSERTVRRVLRNLFPSHPRRFRWQIEANQASEIVDKIKGSQKRKRKNQFNRQGETQ